MEDDRGPEQAEAEGRGLVEILIGGGLAWVQIAVEVRLVDPAQRPDLEAVGLEQGLVADQRVEPGELAEQPGVAADQVVFQVGEEVVRVQPVAQGGLALKAQE